MVINTLDFEKLFENAETLIQNVDKLQEQFANINNFVNWILAARTIGDINFDLFSLEHIERAIENVELVSLDYSTGNIVKILETTKSISKKSVVL